MSLQMGGNPPRLGPGTPVSRNRRQGWCGGWCRRRRWSWCGGRCGGGNNRKRWRNHTHASRNRCYHWRIATIVCRCHIHIPTTSEHQTYKESQQKPCYPGHSARDRNLDAGTISVSPTILIFPPSFSSVVTTQVVGNGMVPFPVRIDGNLVFFHTICTWPPLS